MVWVQRNNKRCGKGSAIIETLIGLFIMVPVSILLIDCGALVLGQQANDALAKHCARAAAETTSYSSAEVAVNGPSGVISGFHQSNLCCSPSALVVYPANAASVLVVTSSTCIMPIQVPFVPNQFVFKAEATEPIVAALPN